MQLLLRKMIVYITKHFSILFLLLQEKNQKKQAKGALSCRAPARQRRPLWKSQSRIAGSWSHLNLNPDLGRNVPISAQMAGSMHIGRAASAPAAAISKAIHLKISLVKVLGSHIVRAGWGT